MKRYRVIRAKDLPPRPLGFIVSVGVCYLFLDRWHVPGWCYGVFWTLVAFLAFAHVWAFVACDSYPVQFGSKPDSDSGDR